MALAEGTLNKDGFFCFVSTLSDTTYRVSLSFFFLIPDLINFLYLLYILYFAEGNVG